MKHRADANQEGAVRYLRSLGMSVEVLSQTGNGCPDLIVGFHEINLLVELKNGDKPPSQQKLTQAQTDWHAAWGGTAIVANSAEGVATAVIAECRKRGAL